MSGVCPTQEAIAGLRSAATVGETEKEFQFLIDLRNSINTALGLKVDDGAAITLMNLTWNLTNTRDADKLTQPVKEALQEIRDKNRGKLPPRLSKQMEAYRGLLGQVKTARKAVAEKSDEIAADPACTGAWLDLFSITMATPQRQVYNKIQSGKY
ncbi:hypothetical protein ACFL5U_03640 [Candidatus Margulisiibacteriota bacterium]